MGKLSSSVNLEGWQIVTNHNPLSILRQPQVKMKTQALQLNPMYISLEANPTKFHLAYSEVSLR